MRKQQQYLCSPKSCHPHVRWWELVLPLRWPRSERLPSLSTITPQGLRTRMHSAHFPHPRSKPAALCILDRNREWTHKEVLGCILVNSVSDRRIQTPTLQETSKHPQSQQLCIWVMMMIWNDFREASIIRFIEIHQNYVLMQPLGCFSGLTRRLLCCPVLGLSVKVWVQNTSLVLIAISGCTPKGTHGQDRGGRARAHSAWLTMPLCMHTHTLHTLLMQIQWCTINC